MPSTSATSTKKFLNRKAEYFVPQSNYLKYRKGCEYKTFNENFKQELNLKDYENQFLHLYNYRLENLGPICSKLAKEKWSKEFENVQETSKVLDAVDTLNFIVGTVYRKLKFKPSIFDDVSKQLWVVNPPPVDHYYDDNDEIYLEDDSGRLQLIHSNWNDFTPLVTGAVVAVLGRKTPDGSFDVIDIQFPDLPEQSPLSDVTSTKDEKYVAILSNLNLGPNQPITTTLELLSDYFSGLANQDADDDDKFSSCIVGLILAGDLFTFEGRQDSNSNTSVNDSIAHIDQFLSNLACHIPIFAMPGSQDPANVTLPQSPLHKVLFPKASKNQNFHSLTNPSLIQLDQTKILGTSGQNIDDLMKYSSDSTALTWLESTLKYRHISPNAPDTQYSFPYKNQDPLILKDCPHIYFASNQPQLSSKLLTGSHGQKVRLVSIPKFQSKNEVILISLNGLNIKKMNLNQLD